MSNHDDFSKIMQDFKKDVLLTFPEYSDKIDCDNHNYEYYKEYYPKHFFNILYRNDEIFNTPDGAFFIPNVNFTDIWKSNITEKTKGIIWKYLQLVLFTVVNNEKDSKLFGEAERLFEAIDEKDFKQKLEEAIGDMSELFEDGADLSSCAPNVDELNDHISDILDGNLGKLAKEIAEETADEFNIDENNASSMGDVFKNLIKDPSKLMNIIKKVGDKIGEKLESGELKESEMLDEASKLLEKMKSMPGMKNMKNLFSKMGLPFNKNMNMGAMKSSMERNVKCAKMRERLQRKLKLKKEMKEKNFEEQKELLKQLLEESTAPKKVRRKKGKKKRRKRGKNKK